jgi:hypothetical protein
MVDTKELASPPTIFYSEEEENAFWMSSSRLP